MTTHHIDPIRTDRVARAKRNITTGFYDRPEVLDIATARLHAHLMELMTADARHAERLAQDASEPGREYDGGI